MTATRLRVLLVAALTALGLVAWTKYVLPLGARALPAILLVGWMYLVTRLIARPWRTLGPPAAIVLGNLAFQAFVAVWLIAALAIAVRSITAGTPPIPASGESLGHVFLWLTAPFWWGLGCALVILYRRAG